MYVCEYVHNMHAGAQGHQKRASEPLNLGLHPVWVLETKLVLSTRAVCAVKNGTISPVQTNFLILHLPKSLKVFIFSKATAR